MLFLTTVQLFKCYTSRVSTQSLYTEYASSLFTLSLPSSFSFPPTSSSQVCPEDHPAADFDFDVLIGADGRRSTIPGFDRKELRGKLALAITANFINYFTREEAGVEEISGVAFIFNQKVFKVGCVMRGEGV